MSNLELADLINELRWKHHKALGVDGLWLDAVLLRLAPGKNYPVPWWVARPKSRSLGMARVELVERLSAKIAEIAQRFKKLK